jgi:hypothetical protein
MMPNGLENPVRKLLLLVPVLLVLRHAGAPAAGNQEKQPAAFPKFRMQEIATDLEVGYAVLLVDIDGDNKRDIVVADSKRVIWYQNPTWKMRTITKPGQTASDNVCLDAYDIDGDGQLDLALGADWKPFNTKSGGTLQWLKRGKSLDEPWTVYPIDNEPTVHRIRFIDIDGSGKPALVLAPLMGRNATAAMNWMDGEPARLTAYRIPKDPTRERWQAEVIDHSLHVVHNFCGIEAKGRKGMDLLCASYEGVTWLTRDGGGKWSSVRRGDGNQANLKSNRGSSEVKQGRLKNGKAVIATIEPWHGNQVVVYTEPDDSTAKWARHVVDEQLKWGHAVWFADLDGDGGDELVIGVRDDLSKNLGERCGVRIYKAMDESGAKWQRHDVDPGGVAVEDLACADLNGDGRMDIVAVGRKTKNVRIYWNEK